MKKLQKLLEKQNEQAVGRDLLLQQLREQEASLLQQMGDLRHSCSERLQLMQDSKDDLVAREKAKEAQLASTLREMREVNILKRQLPIRLTM